MRNGPVRPRRPLPNCLHSARGVVSFLGISQDSQSPRILQVPETRFPRGSFRAHAGCDLASLLAVDHVGGAGRRPPRTRSEGIHSRVPLASFP